MSSKVVDGCSACAKVTRGKTCAVFSEPAWFWTRYGHCPGYTEDTAWLEKHVKAVEDYARLKGAVVQAVAGEAAAFGH